MTRPTVVALLLALAAPAAGQETLSLQGVLPAGLRASATESWGTYLVTVSNNGATARDVRVLILYPGRPDEQYGADLWLPPKSVRTAYVPVGPAAGDNLTTGREVQALLFDRTGGQNRLILPPGEIEQKVRSRVVGYRKRATTTVLILDPPADGDFDDRAADTEAMTTAHVMRHGGGLPEHLSVVRDAFLPAMDEAFDGVDQVILAGRRLAADPGGRTALRAWVQRGGRLWVMLDRTDPAVVAPLLGDDFAVEVVDRVGLTDVRFHRPVEPLPANGTLFEEPIDLVRVTLPPGWRVLDQANGWPATFSRRVGRGNVVVTTVGARAWHRPRVEGRDPKSPYERFRFLPIPLLPLAEVARELEVKDEPTAVTEADLAPLVNEAVGYSVVDRTTVGGILGEFVLGVLGAGAYLRRSGKAELVGWLAPGAAVLAGVGLVGVGEASRRAVAPTAAIVAVVDAVPGSDAAAARGVFAVYRPDSGPVPLTARRGGILDLDPTGLDGQLRRHVATDLGAWEWVDLSVPAGVRTGTFRWTARPGPLTAVARFGSDGIEGTLASPTFAEPSDGLLLTQNREPLAVRFADDGTFTALGESLPPGQFATGTVLTDRQQRRQDVYRKLLTGPLPKHMADRDLLLAWTRPTELPFDVADATRIVGSVLLIVPLDLKPAEPGGRVTIPAAFVPHRRMANNKPMVATTESDFPIEQVLRFQLPSTALPMTVEKAVLTAKVRAPSRKFTITATADGKREVLAAVDGPTEPVRVEVTDARLLRPDDRGGLSFGLAFGVWEGPHNPWKIESVGLEVVGRAGR